MKQIWLVMFLACCVATVVYGEGTVATGGGEFVLKWEVPADDFLVWGVWETGGKGTTGGGPSIERFFNFGRNIPASGYETQPLGWAGKLVQEQLPFAGNTCPQFRLLAWLPDAAKQPGDSWKQTIYLGALKLEAEYTFEKIVQVPNVPPDKGTHDECVIRGKAVFVDQLPPDGQKGDKVYLKQGSAFKCEWVAQYDPARKIVTQGELDLEIHWVEEKIGGGVKKPRDPYSEDERDPAAPGPRDRSAKCKQRYALEKWYPANYPESSFQQEKGAAIDAGLGYVRKHARSSGEISCDVYKDHRDGQTALAAYTLLKCGGGVGDKEIVKAMDYLLGKALKTYTETYTVCLSILAAEEFVRRVEEINGNDNLLKQFPEAKGQKARADKLQELLKGLSGLLQGEFKKKGAKGWGYITARPEMEAAYVNRTDNSNTQFVALALNALDRHEATRVPDELWRGVLSHALKGQLTDGSWDYGADWRENRYMSRNNFNMTCAGLACLLFAKTALQSRGALAEDVRGEVDVAVASAVEYLEGLYDEWNEYAADFQLANYYYLYSLERACTLAKLDRLKKLDWYRENALVLFQIQEASGKNAGQWRYESYGHMPNTCFALLFLYRVTQTMVTTEAGQ